MPQMGGVFYQVARPDVLIVDAATKPGPTTQEALRNEISDYEELMAMDYEYCNAVEGVSQESGLWVARNQHRTGFADADLQRFKNVTWNECVVKKFLTSREGDADVVGKSMLNIIQSLNLQWGSLQVMGLHPKIEAAEKQIVMSCMERALLPFDVDVGKIARTLRRCDHFCDFFANAVGAQIVANTGRTPGLSKTMYGTDMDYAYRDKAIFYLERALQRCAAVVADCIRNVDSTDYVPRLTQLKIVQPEGAVELQALQQNQAPGAAAAIAVPTDPGISRSFVKDAIQDGIKKGFDGVQMADVKQGLEQVKAQTAQSSEALQNLADVLLRNLTEQIRRLNLQRTEAVINRLEASLDTHIRFIEAEGQYTHQLTLRMIDAAALYPGARAPVAAELRDSVPPAPRAPPIPVDVRPVPVDVRPVAPVAVGPARRPSPASVRPVADSPPPEDMAHNDERGGPILAPPATGRVPDRRRGTMPGGPAPAAPAAGGDGYMDVADGAVQ